MPNFKKEILENVGEELNSAIIVVTSFTPTGFIGEVKSENLGFPEELKEKPQKLKEVIDYFDYEYSEDSMRNSFHNVIIFLKDRITYTHEGTDTYNSIERYLSWLPRNPKFFTNRLIKPNTTEAKRTKEGQILRYCSGCKKEVVPIGLKGHSINNRKGEGIHTICPNCSKCWDCYEGAV